MQKWWTAPRMILYICTRNCIWTIDVRPIRPVLTRMHPCMLIAYKQICTQTCMTCFLRRMKFTYLHRRVPTPDPGLIISINFPGFTSAKVKTTYFLHVGKRNCFGQQYGLQSITLTSYFYKNIYLKVVFVYFYKSIFQDKSIHVVFIVWNSIN
jgi:hypothetical protein